MVVHTSTVPCSCCGYDCYSTLWGVGYDTQPDHINVYGHTLPRVAACQYELKGCLNSYGQNLLPITWTSGVCNAAQFRIMVSGYAGYWTLFVEAPQSEPAIWYPCSAWYSTYIHASYKKNGETSPQGVYTLEYTYSHLNCYELGIVDKIGTSPAAPLTLTVS